MLRCFALVWRTAFTMKTCYFKLTCPEASMHTYFSVELSDGCFYSTIISALSAIIPSNYSIMNATSKRSLNRAIGRGKVIACDNLEDLMQTIKNYRFHKIRKVVTKVKHQNLIYRNIPEGMSFWIWKDSDDGVRRLFVKRNTCSMSEFLDTAGEINDNLIFDDIHFGKNDCLFLNDYMNTYDFVGRNIVEIIYSESEKLEDVEL